MPTTAMTIDIKKTHDGTWITLSGSDTSAQRVEIVPGSIREASVEIGKGTPVLGVELTVRPA